MSTWATMICDGCATQIVDIPLPDGRALVRLIEAVHDAHWSTPIRGIWLCPACAEITQTQPAPEIVTEAMW